MVEKDLPILNTKRNFQKYLATVDEKGRPEEFDKMMSDARLLILNSNYNVISKYQLLQYLPNKSYYTRV